MTGVVAEDSKKPFSHQERETGAELTALREGEGGELRDLRRPGIAPWTKSASARLGLKAPFEPRVPARADKVGGGGGG